MEKMTNNEKKMLNELQAKLKRVQRAEAQFYKDADERKDELLERWNLENDKLGEIADLYDTDKDTLLTWLVEQEQIERFHEKQKTTE